MKEEFELDETTLVAYYGTDQDIVIPEGVTKIDCHVFNKGERSYLPRVKSVVFPESLQVIGYCTFFDCELESLRLPGQLQEIDHMAFNSNPFREVEIPASVKRVGGASFCGCKKLTRVSLPEGLEKLERSAFAACTALEEISIPGSVSELECTFYDCTQLKRVELHEGLKTLTDQVFGGCTSLQELRIPETVTKIDDRVFGESKPIRVTVLAVRDSYAYRWAKEHGFPVREVAPERPAPSQTEAVGGQDLKLAIENVKGLKELVDLGILTSAEFEKKKKELLGL